ncbi:dihydroxyacetone kinase phosphoryl donor subunit DhaM [Saccharothrix coeruleofusca]|uniref:Phosphocarrier protein HPr n=1 Tax=Saccharothrix coeruleofusca TaxID=33919 RepID=A0A918ECU3_9PSEU|nr:dihydroxyacetone kinase phosphoryl donor subunit DhaM [Saccharothrix coeruleofusca]GGP46333.1 PTS sugar transporter subunit IIA [Saccharothrix coeruleofusca]
MIGLVVVSHSALLARGVAELAGQMAPDVRIEPSGGDGSGGLGTDFLDVGRAIGAADSGDGVVVLFDLGSARMVAEMAAEEHAGEVAVVDAPLVEGAVAAAVAAQGGAALAAVAEAATTGAAPAGAAPGGDGPSGVPAATAVTAEVLLTNDVGLHARPAALLVRALTGLDAEVVVRLGERSADARSVMALMALGAVGGRRVAVEATGADAAEAVRRVEELAARGFDD